MLYLCAYKKELSTLRQKYVVPASQITHTVRDRKAQFI